MRYWAYINNEIKGPFEPNELIKIDGFSPTTLVCPQSSVEEETKEWKEAREIPELAIFTSSKLPTEKETEIQTSELQQTQKKEEIIIERFGIENLFAPAPDIELDKISSSSTDPLTLSQIRKRVELTQKETENNQKTKDDIKPNLIEEPPKEYQSVPPQELPKETIEEFKIPSTDELLKTIEKTNEELNQIQSYIEPIQTIEREESKDNLQDLDSIKQKDIPYIDEIELNKKVEEKFYQFREIILNEINKTLDEKLDLTKKEFYQKLQSNQTNSNIEIDIQRLKDEILATLDSKISSLQNQQPTPLTATQDDSFKKDFDDLKNLVRHIEIEVRDLRTRTESIENKIKTEPATLSRENLSQQANTSFNQSFNETNEKPKKDKNNNISKTILTILLIPIALGSILFMLKQFGIFDFTVFFASKDKKQEITQSMPPEQPPITQTLTQNTSEQFYIQTTTDTNLNTQQLQISKQEIQQTQTKAEEKKDIPLESIINEVKDYKIKSPHNLEKTITMILKSRKADLSSIKWEAQKKDEENKYLIIVNAKASKPIEFRFEFDFKTKLLQPLNTLSVNTLKMMMEETKENKKISTPNQTNQKQKKQPQKINQEKKSKAEPKSQQLNKESDEDGQVFVDETQYQKTEEEAETDDYLIIGE